MIKFVVVQTYRGKRQRYNHHVEHESETMREAERMFNVTKGMPDTVAVRLLVRQEATIAEWVQPS